MTKLNSRPRIKQNGGQQIAYSRGDYSFVFSSNLADWQTSIPKQYRKKKEKDKTKKV